jgi:predicted secreted protein
MVCSRQKDARVENSNINYGMDTREEKKNRTSKKNVDGRSTSSHESKNLEQDQWRNRAERRLVSGRRRQLL